MKRKLVLWGKNPQEEKVLITLELVADENKVKTNIISGELASTENYNALMEKWRVGQEYTMPEGIESSVKDLVISESLLPEGYKIENESLVERAKTEWHFVVLSSKLHSTYRSELEDFKDKIEKLSEYDAAVWDSLKAYWSKVQAQVSEKNLFWDHANELRNGTNSLFSRMKELRAVVDEEFRTQSKVYAEGIISSLNEIEEKVKENVNLGALFNQLKDIQKKYRDTKFTKEDRNKVWNKIDGAFKIVKEKRFGKEQGPSNTPHERLQRRYEGLMKAMEKMERSIKRDEDELKFQERRAERTEGQLELQIRQAKITMLQQRVDSKREKFRDMQKTEKELARKLEKFKAKKAAAQPATPPPPADKKATAEAPKKETPAADAKEPDGAGLADALGATLGESIGDVMDTVKAVADVIGSKVSEAVQEFKEELEEMEAEKKATKEEEE